jgi:hypothetical protein
MHAVDPILHSIKYAGKLAEQKSTFERRIVKHQNQIDVQDLQNIEEQLERHKNLHEAVAKIFREVIE